MPKDIRINWDEDYLEGDFVFDTDLQDLESDEGLETAVLISLFTDQRAKDDDILPDDRSDDKRGWWGDLVSPFADGDQIGSRLWLLERSKTTPSVLQKAKQYVTEALQWMVEDGVASKVEIEVERQGISGNDILAIKVMIYRNDNNIKTLKYDLQWEAQSLRG